MNQDILKQCAYHESGRVVFAYLADYTCSKIELSEVDAGKGSSTLSGGNDNSVIKRIMAGERPAAFTDMEEGYEVANRLMVLYCAGSCTRTFYERGTAPAVGAEMDIPGQDSIYIDKLQKFMKECSPAHHDNYVSVVMTGIFQQLGKKDIWKAITQLAEAAVSSYDKPLNRYTIEDTLMGSGFKINRPAAQSGFSVGVSETPDETVKQTETREVKTPTVEIPDESPLDIVLKNYLKKICTDWSDKDIDAAAAQVKSIFSKYGNSKNNL